MPLVGLSTLYLSIFGRPYDSVYDELRKIRKTEEAPQLWELVDIANHSLTSSRIARLRELQPPGVQFTVHCPYDVAEDICSLDPLRRQEALQRMKQSVEAASQLEAVGWVLHPGSVKEAIDKVQGRELNQESVLMLADYASGLGVVAALENMIRDLPYAMGTLKDYQEFYETTGSKLLMTFDPGHAHLANEVDAFIAEMAGRFFIIHTHDNRGNFDEHLNVGEGTLDWQLITDRLLKQRFRGIFIVEAVRNPEVSVKALRGLLQRSGARH